MFIRKIILITVLAIMGNLWASTTIRAIDEAFARGELSPDEMILNKIYAIFEPQSIDSRFRVDNIQDLKCGTPILIQYENMQSDLLESTVSIVESFLEVNRDLRDIYDSPGGHFRFNYSTTGGDAVPNITPAPASGLGWSIDQLAFFLKTGTKPDWEAAAGVMGEAVTDGYKYLTDEDLRALARYINTLPPIENHIGG
ncbi:MAG: hypothetical protein L3J79_01510 [Candidatus Marinimicrobia bacterium]|nr:hypothetical protein [Candidatus Neomarinimicrobiota bacterium]